MTSPQPFTISESFSTYGTFSNQVSLLTDLNTNFSDICGNLVKYNVKKQELDKYSDFSGNYLEYRDKPSTVQDAAKEDINQMIIQQNNVYIIGMISVTTILISLYLMLKK